MEGRTVVAVEYYQGILGQTQFNHLGLDATDQFIHVFHHIVKKPPILLVAVFTPLRAIRGRLKRAMGQCHGVVDEKGLVPVALHKMVQVIHKQIGPIFSLRILQVFSIVIYARIGKPASLVLCVLGMPKKKFLETRFLDPLSQAPPLRHETGRIIALQLPFAHYAGAVSSLGHPVAEGFFFGFQNPKGMPVSPIVFPRHQGHPRRGAERKGMGIGKAHPVLCQSIQNRGFVGYTSIATERFRAQVVGHDQDDIWLGSYIGRRG